MPEPKPHLRIAGLVARAFINSKLTPLFIAGGAAGRSVRHPA